MTDSPPLLFTATPLGLRPANDAATEAVKACTGTVKVEIKQSRGNDRRLAKYWVTAKIVADNWPMETGTVTAKWLHVQTKRKLGLSKYLGRTTAGTDAWDDESISFRSMNEPDRAAYIDQAFELWASVLGVTKDELLAEQEAA